MNLNWKIYFDGERWNYDLAQDKDESNFTGSVAEVYEYVTELDKKDANQFYAQQRKC